MHRPAIALLVVAGCLGAAAAAAAAPSRAATPARGNFAGRIAIGGGRSLWLRCAGRGQPVVVLESGIHDSSDPWTLTQTRRPVTPTPAVFPGVARFTRVCMYDRPGTVRYTGPRPVLTTRSTPVAMPRTLTGMVRDLRTLLARAHVPGPYVLAGHSYGGLIVRLFAQTHPSRTAGLVMLDAFGPPLQHLFGPLWPRYVARLNHPGTPIDADPGFETVNTGEAFASVRRAPRLAAFPMVVVSKTEPFGVSPDFPVVLHTRLEAAWPRAQQALVRLEPDTPHVYATGSDHYVQMHAPDVSIAAIRLVVTRARGGGA